jgi:hypothetical protein
VLLEYRVSLAFKACRETQGFLVIQDIKVLLVQEEESVLRECKGPLGFKGVLEYRE